MAEAAVFDDSSSSCATDAIYRRRRMMIVNRCVAIGNNRYASSLHWKDVIYRLCKRCINGLNYRVKNPWMGGGYAMVGWFPYGVNGYPALMAAERDALTATESVVSDGGMVGVLALTWTTEVEGLDGMQGTEKEEVNSPIPVYIYIKKLLPIY
ncbi:hypothetical protein L1987_01227 [Smallanthus sonchifolius]|uniref:Uncharacterized protein n=1 Tax=Smallanthus sonchifolius TaxID=185202 RepID=A0ACB9K4I5_9ASTR|nr:hypothetical protein L1987_01227 [Smallanthus sonchifolius]